MTERTAAENQALLAAAIERSGLSVGAWARSVVIRDPRTVRKWLSGEREIPRAVLGWLHEEGQNLTDPALEANVN